MLIPTYIYSDIKALYLTSSVFANKEYMQEFVNEVINNKMSTFVVSNFVDKKLLRLMLKSMNFRLKRIKSREYKIQSINGINDNKYIFFDVNNLNF